MFNKRLRNGLLLKNSLLYYFNYDQYYFKKDIRNAWVKYFNYIQGVKEPPRYFRKNKTTGK